MQDLMPDEKEILQELNEDNVEPMPAMDGQFADDDSIQRNIIGALLTDYYFLCQSQGMVKPHFFRNEAHQTLCRAVFKYFEKYKNVPPKHFILQELEDAIANKKPEIKQYYRVETNVVYDFYIPGLDAREYLLDRITDFAKAQGLKAAFKKSLDELNNKQEGQETWLKIHDILREALTIDRHWDPGLDYFQTFEERYIRMAKQQEEGESFTSGFEAIDSAIVGGGLSKGELGAWMGLPGTGKSLALVAAALANMHLGKKVLYISLEMDADKVAERFDAQLASMSNDGKVTINTLLENKEIVFECLKEYVKEYEDPCLLRVKQFAAGAMDVATLRAYMTQSKLYGFSPDLLILDYVGEMKDYPNMPTWESRNKIVRDLRGMAVEEQICILTAMQPGRSARDQSNEQKELGFIDDSNLADAFGQSRPVDAMWSINQFQEEKDCGLARIFVVKHRHGKSRFTFHVEFDYKTLRMSQINCATYEKRLKEYRSTKEVLIQNATQEKIKNKLTEDKIDKIIGGSTNLPDMSGE